VVSSLYFEGKKKKKKKKKLLQPCHVYVNPPQVEKVCLEKWKTPIGSISVSLDPQAAL
jgi:hypothetical protein